MSKSFLLIFIIFTNSFVFGSSNEAFSVFGKLKDGLKMAGQLLGLNKVDSVTKLVSETFASTQSNKKGDTGQMGSNMFSGFFRLFGLDTSKISAIAVNAIVFLAQLISSSLSKPSPPELTQARNLRFESTMDWILNSNNQQLTHLLEIAKDRNLPTHIIEYLKERTSDEETPCIQLLICKCAPFLWAMQKAIAAQEPKQQMTHITLLYKYLPSAEFISEHGDECEQKYPMCSLNQ